jgi:hypothetical protein
MRQFYEKCIQKWVTQSVLEHSLNYCERIRSSWHTVMYVFHRRLVFFPIKLQLHGFKVHLGASKRRWRSHMIRRSRRGTNSVTVKWMCGHDIQWIADRIKHARKNSNERRSCAKLMSTFCGYNTSFRHWAFNIQWNLKSDQWNPLKKPRKSVLNSGLTPS